jgi:dynein heavy chain
VSAAFLAYSGAFTSEYRESVFKSWSFAVRKNGLPHNKKLDLTVLLADPNDVMDWNIDGLPADTFSTENGVLVERGLRWPLMIDPQGQANKWIRNKEAKNLEVCDFQTPGYMKIIERSVTYGSSLLIEDLMEEMDPALDPILRLTRRDKPKDITLNDNVLPYGPTFRLFFTTKLSNPHYKPELGIQTNLINFGVKMQGLEDQLLGIVVRMESAELEREKSECVRTVAANKRLIANLEDEILTLLNSNNGDLLDDPELNKTLQRSRVTAAQVKEQLKVAAETGIKIDNAREGYRPSATRAAVIYFVLNDLAMVDPMYQFSLQAYIELFKQSIEKSAIGKDRDNMDMIDRLHGINNYHTEAVYNYTCRALFEKHKLLFAFKLCVEKLKVDEKIDLEQYDFFLKGGIVMDRSERPENPCNEWLSELAWDGITELDKIAAFNGIAASFEINSTDWQNWYRSDDPPPEKVPLPGDWQSGKKDEFQVMCVLRCLRPDRVVFAARSFISNPVHLGPKFVEPPPFDMKNIYDSSTAVTPLIFVLSAGVDPTGLLQGLAKSEGMLESLGIISLGQGQKEKAEKLLKDGVENGKWVFLANCHLSISWLPDLQKFVERLSVPGNEPHPNFRLWLSSDPHPKFPIALLQVAVKMTTEPPKGLKANLMRLYNTNLTDDVFEASGKPEKYKKLMFSLCFFHSVMIERKKFLSLGWNIMYDFNDSDWDICENLLKVYLDLYEETPWDALKYLIAQANYGGRVTDDQDRRLLVVYADQYFCEDALNLPNYQLAAPLEHYRIPMDGPRDQYIKYIQTLPDAANDPPEAFGQHPNADIASQMEATKTLLGTILSLQPRAVAAAGTKTPEDTILELIEKLSDQIQQPLDMKNLLRRFKNDKTPLTVVLLQELSRYNIILKRVATDLDNLKKGISGLVVISSYLEDVFDSLLNGIVPSGWGKVYPSIKPLGPWARDLVERVDFFLNWSANGPPKVFWLSAFTFPTGFLTALLQNTARKNDIEIDNLSWEFVVMTHNKDAINMQPKEGAYVNGLFLEGARWNMEAGCLAEPAPMELFCTMPIILFKPVENKKKGSKGMHATPMYLYPVRTGSRERPSFMIEVDLKAGVRGETSQFWTKRGVALLLSLAE